MKGHEWYSFQILASELKPYSSCICRPDDFRSNIATSIAAIHMLLRCINHASLEEQNQWNMCKITKGNFLIGGWIVQQTVCTLESQ
jgi:hypothetical protein